METAIVKIQHLTSAEEEAIRIVRGIIEEKSRKDKLWKVECTVPQENAYYLAIELKNQVPFNYIENVGKYAIFNIYCATQEQSATVKLILNEYNAKYFVTETKNL